MQSDIEIDKALALAIGYKLFDVKFHDDMWAVLVFQGSWRVFSHRDWNVIGPIAARYDCFPWKDCRGDWVNKHYQHTTTPQRAIALAVIHGALK